MTATEIAHLLAERAEDVARLLLPAGKRVGHEWHVGDLTGAPGSSLKLVIAGPKAGAWCDFATAETGDLIGLWQTVCNIDLPDACASALAWLSVLDDGGRKRVAITKPTSYRPPPLQRGSFDDVRTLAALRGFPSWAGLEILTDRGLLCFADVRDGAEAVRAWFLTDSSQRNFQSRRLDGKSWQHLSGAPKAWTWPGSQASWPIGAADIGDRRKVALVEGAPDLLAAAHFAFLENVHEGVAFVCITGASNSIHEEARPAFRGRQVRIFCHCDESGAKAGARWAAQLRGVGADVDGFHFTGLEGPAGLPCKDLADLAQWPVEHWCTATDVERDARECGAEGPTLGPASPSFRHVFAGMDQGAKGGAAA